MLLRLGYPERYLAHRLMNIRRFKQFSIASILALTATIALTVRFWPEAETVESRVENWTEHFWFDYSVGVVQRRGSSNVWDEYSVVSGQGTVCVLRDGSWIKNTTGGSYYSVMIQLPAKLDVGDEFTISPFHAPTSNVVKEIREMKSGTMIAMQFGNPFSWSLDGVSTDSTGKIIVKELGDDYVRIHAKFDLILNDNRDNAPLEIDETFTVDRGYPDSPLEIERKIDSAR